MEEDIPENYATFVMEDLILRVNVGSSTIQTETTRINPLKFLPRERNGSLRVTNDYPTI